MQHDGGATEHRQGQQFAPAVPDQRAHERLCAFFQARTCVKWEEVAGLDICCEPVYNVVAVRVLEGIGATAILRVYVFGSFGVLCDGNPMPSSAWRSQQARTLSSRCCWPSVVMSSPPPIAGDLPENEWVTIVDWIFSPAVNPGQADCTLHTTCLQRSVGGCTEMLVGGFLGAGIGLASRRSN
ncbi:MAG: hypothetical protein IMY75_03700 [Chloroflexi bacterium]|nr:hypothetical protein [Chloroflexota bacterium]